MACKEVNLLILLGLRGSHVPVVLFAETDLNANGLETLFRSLGARLCAVSPRTAEAMFLGFTVLGQEQGAADKSHFLGQV